MVGETPEVSGGGLGGWGRGRERNWYGQSYELVLYILNFRHLRGMGDLQWATENFVLEPRSEVRCGWRLGHEK